MEISEKALRAMVREVDDQHRATLATFGDEAIERHVALLDVAGRTTRREFARRLGLATVAIGSATVPLASFASPAAAQEADDAPLTIDQLLSFAQAVELAAVEAYLAATASGKVTTPAVLSAATTFADHHRQHAAVFGRDGSARANPALVQQVGDQITAAADERAVIDIAYTVENAATSTYQFAIAEIARFDAYRPAGDGATTTTSPPASTPGAQQAQTIVASILPIEASHAVVLGAVLGHHLEQEPRKVMLPPFESQAAALDPRALAPELFPSTTSTTTA